MSDNSNRAPTPPGMQRSDPVIRDDLADDTDATSDTISPTRGVQTVDADDIDLSWTDYFPYDSVYQDQVDGINDFIETLTDHGYMVTEGACGTGKTLIGLVGGLYALRRESEAYAQFGTSMPDYDRVFAVTSVKQQTKQFIEEMRSINNQLDGNIPFPTIVLQGKSDISPYAFLDDDTTDRGEHVSLGDHVRNLEENTEDLIEFGSNIPLVWPADMNPPEQSMVEGSWNDVGEENDIRDDYTYDPYRVEAVYRILSDTDDSDDRLTVKGVESPYLDDFPTYRDVVDASTDKGRQVEQMLDRGIEPFYVGFLYDNEVDNGLSVTFSDGMNSVLDAYTLRDEAVRAGISPPRTMAKLMQSADVIIGNYYHILDRKQTRLLTDMKAGVLDGTTITIVDEAHNLVPAMRNILSDEIGAETLDRARNDVQNIKGYLDKSPGSISSPIGEDTLNHLHREVSDIFAGYEIEESDLAMVISTITELRLELFEQVDKRLINDRYATDGDSSAVEKPKEATIDEVTENIRENAPGDTPLTLLYQVGMAIEGIYDTIDELDREPIVGSVSSFFDRWAKSSGTTYLREVAMESASRVMPAHNEYDWSDSHNPSYKLYNTLPTDPLRSIFSELGGGILMSATLEPIDTYLTTTGIDRCVHPDAVEDKEERAVAITSGEADQDDDIEFRDVTVSTFPLRFPRKNRESYIVTAPKFTSSERGKRTRSRSAMSETRKQYADIVETIANSHGNVLMAFPSYKETEWAYNVARNSSDIQKSTYLDQSSSTEDTDALLEKFWNGDNSILFTSARGTVTEGVDYDGDKLHTVAVFGISLVPPSDEQKATEYAYESELDVEEGGVAANYIPATRKARQAIGRAIRGDDERGVRLLVDERYNWSGNWGANDYLNEQEQNEFSTVSPAGLEGSLDVFWSGE